MKTIAEYDFDNFPEYAQSIAEGDDGCHVDDLKNFRDWFTRLGTPRGQTVWSFAYDSHFSWHPEFGLACDCVTAKLKILE